MTPKPRVLFLSSWPLGAHGEGAASFVYEQIAALSNDVRAAYVEHRFDGAVGWARRRTAGRDIETIGDLWPERVNALRIWTPRWSPRLTRRGLLDDVWRAGAMVGKRVIQATGEFDLVHAHVVLPAGLLGASVAQALGLPLILQEHSAPFAMHLEGSAKCAAVKETMRLARVVCAVGDVLASQMTEQCDEPAKIRVIPNLIRTELFTPERLPTDRGRMRLISVGSLEARKGFDVLLDAVAILKESGACVDVRIIGDGPLRAQIGHRLTGLGFDLAVALPGFMTRRNTFAALGAAQIYVCSSNHETFGLAPAEALAAGRPVVSTRCGGPESFVDDTCGAIVEPGDPQAMAKAISRTWNRLCEFDPTSLHERIDMRFGPEAFRTRMLGLYDDVLSDSAA